MAELRGFFAGLLLVATLVPYAPEARAAGSAEDAADVERATVLAYDGQLEQALSLYTEVLARTPGHRAARRGRARVLGWLGRHQESLAELDVLRASDADDVETLIQRARVLGWMQRSDEGEAEVRRAIELAPTSIEARLLLGDLLGWVGRDEEARVAYGNALELDAESEEAREGLRRLDARSRSRDGEPWLRPLSLGFALRFDALDGDRSDWREETLHGAVQLPRNFRVHLSVAQSRRFDEDDTQGAVALSWASGDGWWLGAGGFFAPESEVVARHGFSVELARRVTEFAAVQLAYRRSWYPGGVETDAASAGLEIHWPRRATLVGRYHFTRVTGGRHGHAGSLRIDLFPHARFVPYLGGSFGSEAFAPSTVQAARTQARIASFSAGMLWKLTAGLGVRVGYAFEDLDDTYRRHGIESGLVVEF